MAADQGAGRGRGLCRCVVLDRSGSGGSLGAEMHGEGKVDWVWKEISDKPDCYVWDNSDPG